jgi:dTDP-4-dehydrorhamnose reductase
VKIVIIGANGFMGAALAGALGDRKIPFLRASHTAPADLHLDFTKPLDDFLSALPHDISHAVICSAIADIDRCFERPAETAFFNVLQTQALISAVFARKIVPVFFSTDLVFRGDRGAYTENDERRPTTEYGRQKAAVENFMMDAGAPHLIVRMSKLYSATPSDTSPVLQTIDKLRRGEGVRAALDGIICPTNVADVARGVTRLMADGVNGAVHICAPPEGWYSRYTLAMTLAARLGCEALVEPCLLADLPVKDPRPRNNALLNQRFARLAGWQPRPLATDLDAFMALSARAG